MYISESMKCSSYLMALLGEFDKVLLVKYLNTGLDARSVPNIITSAPSSLLLYSAPGEVLHIFVVP